MREQAADLLDILWCGIPREYKSQYRMTIWTQFENGIRSAAYTSNLAKFCNSVCSKFQARIIKKQDCQKVEEILQGGQDRMLLKLFREQTTLLVLMVRLRAQARFELKEAKNQAVIPKPKEEKDENLLF